MRILWGAICRQLHCLRFALNSEPTRDGHALPPEVIFSFESSLDWKSYFDLDIPPRPGEFLPENRPNLFDLLYSNAQRNGS